MVLPENHAFTLAGRIAIVVGGALAIYGLATRDYFLALIIGWFTFNNFQQWQEYRQRGFPGD
jgi:hypothetical protein